MKLFKDGKMRKVVLKKEVFFLIFMFLIVIIYFGVKIYLNITDTRKNIVLKDDRVVSFNTGIKVSDFIEKIDGIIIDDYNIDTTKIGVQTIKFSFKNKYKRLLDYSFEINVVDDVPPVIFVNDSYRVNVGYSGNLVEDIMVGDNADDFVNIYVTGEYNADVVGDYPLKITAKDFSGNITEKDFVLQVRQYSSNNSGYSRQLVPFSQFINDYKNNNTKIGIDISKWQGDVDFNLLKSSGVEFVFIKIGGQREYNGEFIIDDKCLQNLNRAREAGMEIGGYFYSYATSVKEAQEQAKWVIEKLKDYPIKLPIAFDWENWSTFNKAHLSFYSLTKVANAFMEELVKNGYDSMLYSSKYYLENVWDTYSFPTWLANYTDVTSYVGEYSFWQLSDIGTVPGINGAVDVDIMYIN